MSFLNTLDEITPAPDCDLAVAIEMQPTAETGQFGNRPTNPPYNILIRGKGINLYGMIEKYEAVFPSCLVNVVSEELFFETIDRVNQFLKRVRKIVKKRWILGIVFVCCTWGYSIWPSVIAHRKAVQEFKVLLEEENKQIYHKLGLHWRVTRVISASSQSLPEFAITIEFLDIDKPAATNADVHA